MFTKSTLMNIDLIIILTVSSILHVLTVLKWNQQNIFSCTATTALAFVKLLNIVEMIDESILNVNDDDLIEILLFGNRKICLERKSSIIKTSITLKTLRDFINHFFEQKLMQDRFVLFMF